MRIIQFGAVIIPQFNGAQQLPVPFRSSVVPLRGGGFDQDGANSYPESKNVNIRFQVSGVDTADIDELINSLYTEASKGRRILLAELREGETWQAEAKLLQATVSPDSRNYMTEGNKGYELMQMSFELVYPYWLAIDDLELFFDDGWYMNAGVMLNSSSGTTITTSDEVNDFTIDNNGGVAHQNMELVVTAGVGAQVVDCTVQNLTTGEEVYWGGILEAGETLVIKTLPQSIKYEGVDDYFNSIIPSTQVRFWSLPLGENNFRITFFSVTGGNAIIEFKWARHYIR